MWARKIYSFISLFIFETYSRWREPQIGTFTLRAYLDGIDRIAAEKRTAFFNSWEFLLVCVFLYLWKWLLSSLLAHFISVSMHCSLVCLYVISYLHSFGWIRTMKKKKKKLPMNFSSLWFTCSFCLSPKHTEPRSNYRRIYIRWCYYERRREPSTHETRRRRFEYGAYIRYERIRKNLGHTTVSVCIEYKYKVNTRSKYK